MSKCLVKGCGGECRTRGYCSKHYQRWWTHGDPLIMKRAEKGSGYINLGGYRVISVNGKKVLEHRHVMGQKLGRPLKPYEIVHHKDGNRLNNEEENLEVVNGIGKHNGLHEYYKVDWDSMTHRTCTKCGKEKKVKFFYRHKSGVHAGIYRSRCKRCDNKRRLSYMLELD